MPLDATFATPWDLNTPLALEFLGKSDPPLGFGFQLDETMEEFLLQKSLSFSDMK